MNPERRKILGAAVGGWAALATPTAAQDFTVTQDENEVRIAGNALEAAVRKRGYVSGVAAGSLLDRKTGFRDAGFGLDIVDWIMEPGSDAAYRDRLPGDLPYEYGNLFHGDRPKRSVEGPQICTQAKRLEPRVVRGADFVAVQQSHRYTLAAPGRKSGSLWEQTLVFPRGERYFLSSDRVTPVNGGDLFLRLDMPGHIRHTRGDTFSQVYLSYHGFLTPHDFAADFAPDARFDYRFGRDRMPKRFIRAYRLRDPKTGADGPWLAGMTLDPAVVTEAWCHQRGYVCMIEEFGKRAVEGRRESVRPGEPFSAAFLVGYFDSVEAMHAAYDRYVGNVDLAVDSGGWRLLRETRATV